MRQSRPTPRESRIPVLVFALCVHVAPIMGGCPELRSDVITASDIAVRGLVNALLDLFIIQLRDNEDAESRVSAAPAKHHRIIAAFSLLGIPPHAQAAKFIPHA